MTPPRTRLAAGAAALIAAALPAYAVETLPPTGQTIAGPALVNNINGGPVVVFESTVGVNVCVTLSNGSDSELATAIALGSAVRNRVLAPFRAYSFCGSTVTKVTVNVGAGNAYYRVDKF